VWEQATVDLAPGHTLVIYTDGVTEACNAKERYFGEDGLIGSLRSQFSSSSREVVNTVFTDLQTCMGDAIRSDDITLLAIKREAL